MTDLDQFLAEHGTPEVELAEWELPYLDYFVALESGERYMVRCDNRDMRKAEDTLGGSDKTMKSKLTYTTALVWAGLRRTGQTGLSWQAFEAVCVAIESRNTPDPVDPTGTVGAP